MWFAGVSKTETQKKVFDFIKVFICSWVLIFLWNPFSFSRTLYYDTTFEKCVLKESIFIYEKKNPELKEDTLTTLKPFLSYLFI